MRYHLVIQTPEGDLGAFFAHFSDRGLQPESLPENPSAAVSLLPWCGFLDWQVSSQELEAWFEAQPLSGLWLVLEPDRLLQGYPLRATDSPRELDSLTDLAVFLAAGLSCEPAALLRQAEALFPANAAPLAQSVREVLPLLLSAAGLPQVMGSEPISPAKEQFEFAEPASQIRALAGKLSLHRLDPPLCLKRETAPQQLFLLSWLASDQVAPLLILDVESCEASPTWEWPRIASSALEQDQEHPHRYYLQCEANGTPFGTWQDFADAWAYLLPRLQEGTRLELWLAPLAYDREEQAHINPAGIQRYAGSLQKTGFLLEAAAPTGNSARLTQALVLSEWVLNGGDYVLDSGEALRQFCEDAEREMAEPNQDYFISCERQIRVPAGAKRAFLGRRLFLRAFADLWDLRQSLALMAEIDADRSDLDACFAPWGGAQVRGDELLYQGQSGHFWSGLATGLNALQQRQLAEATQWWQGLGFQALADLIWEPASDVYLRLLLADSRQGIALLLLNSYRFETEMITWFTDGARGVSCSVADLPDFSAERVHYYDWPEGPLSERIAAHWRQAEAYRLRENSPILTLPDSLLELLPLIDQNLLLVRKAPSRF